jgi:hypothetical protein
VPAVCVALPEAFIVSILEADIILWCLAFLGARFVVIVVVPFSFLIITRQNFFSWILSFWDRDWFVAGFRGLTSIVAN